jgi:alkanesulfonate monooxygenase
MEVEFIGMIAAEAKSEIHPPKGPVVDPDYIVRFAQAHEAAGFDRVLVAHNSGDADAVLVATHAAQHTKKLGFMIAHRPGFIAPTYAARLFATFDVFSGGRGGIHIISGGDSGNPVQFRR